MPAAIAPRPPHRATVRPARPAGAIQRMEYPQVCAYCGVARSSVNAQQNCPQWNEWNGTDAPHEWIDDYSGVSNSNNSEVGSSSFTKGSFKGESLESPDRYENAKTWLGLRTLIAPFSVNKRTMHGESPPFTCCSNFSSCAPTPKICELLCDTDRRQLSNTWTVCRGKLIGDIGFHESKKLFLTHLGVMRAELFLEGGAKLVWTFYGSAANVCIVDHQVVHLITGTTQSSSGSCHTEQLCMYWLHDELVRLREQVGLDIREVRLSWFTEKPMCDTWCVPALGLFVSHWLSVGVVVISEAWKV
jgi:hypothetical protein